MHSPHYHASRIMAESPELFGDDMAYSIMVDALMSLGFGREASRRAANRVLG